MKNVFSDEFINQLKENNLLNDYAVLCLNLNNYSYITACLGKDKTKKLLRIFYQEIEKILHDGEKAVILDKDNILVLIKQENVFKFLKDKDYIALPFTNEYFSIDIRTGICNLNESYTINEGIENALFALYAAEWINKVESLVYTDELKENVVKEQRILSMFNNSLNSQDFMVYYQPKVDLNNCSLYGSEALVRWNVNGEIIPPSEFIPLLERENVLQKLDFYMLEHVCMDIRNWINSGINPVKVSVNFSKINFKNPNLSNEILAVLNKYEIDPQYIEIELTETTDISDYRTMIEFVNVMKRNNIHVSIDDFGAGYSSLNLIKSLSVGTIKIDKSFIDFIQNKKDYIIVKSIIDIASELGIDVIAEGVETQQQADILYSMGCNKIQGYYFDKPLSKIEFEKRLDNNKYSKIIKLEK